MESKDCLVVEDHPDVRAWLCACVSSMFPTYRVQGCASLAEAYLALQRLHDPEGLLSLVLVDLGLPDGSGIDFIRQISAQCPDATCVVVTVYEDDAHVYESLAAGAQGYLLKSESREVLERSLARIVAGEPPLSPSIARRIMAYFRQSEARNDRQVSLTPREVEVLACLGRGMRVRDVAQELNISSHTVGDHVKALYRKLSISTRAEAALEAMRRGLIERNS